MKDVFTQMLVTPLQILDMKETAVAELGLNPTLVWAKFILTDDKPNANKVRIPKEEFSNLIRSGIYMPLKMSLGEVGDHQSSRPLGVITHLKEETSEESNRVIGLAALWSEERPEDVDLIRDKFKNKQPLNLSWEISYREDSENSEYAGVKDLLGTVLTGVTIVKVPAYGGRTFMELFASQIEEESKENELTELKTLTELKEALEASNKQLQSQLDEATQKGEELATRITELEAERLTPELKAELESLKEFKQKADDEQKEAAERLAIREAFKAAELEMEDSYFEENDTVLRQMSEEALNLFIESLKATAKAQASLDIPRVSLNDSGAAKNIKELAIQMRKARFAAEEK